MAKEKYVPQHCSLHPGREQHVHWQALLRKYDAFSGADAPLLAPESQAERSGVGALLGPPLTFLLYLFSPPP